MDEYGRVKCHVVGNKKDFIGEVKPRGEVVGMGLCDDSSESAFDSDCLMDWDGGIKKVVRVSSAGLVDGTRDMMEIQERYREIGKTVKRLLVREYGGVEVGLGYTNRVVVGCGSVREQKDYWDDLLKQLQVNYGLVDRMIRRLKGFYDEVGF
jgi:hypothetical protein